jgi:hypothetical protein
MIAALLLLADATVWAPHSAQVPTAGVASAGGGALPRQPTRTRTQRAKPISSR